VGQDHSDPGWKSSNLGWHAGNVEESDCEKYSKGDFPLKENTQSGRNKNSTIFVALKQIWFFTTINSP
jgi:hypothetical protein